MHFVVSILLLFTFVLATGIVSPLHATENNKYWVYFTDKGTGIPSSGALGKYSGAYQQAVGQLSTRALQRRAKVLPAESLVDASDAPLYEPYINTVLHYGATLRQQSRWLNAASVVASAEQVQAIALLPFVRSVVQVITVRGTPLPQDNVATSRTLFSATSYDYGPSFDQVDMIRATTMHELGITGKEVRIGMLDSGFRWKTHEALQGRNIVDEYDFIFHDDVTSNQSNDVSSQDQHGTITLSTLGGFKEGKLIGPAFDAEFLLAKTEFIPSETQVEEDDWAAGLEWLEANGADIVSSSVGYNIFDDDSGYTWEDGDFNGRTSVTAQAAIRAARLGVLVCTSMGNEGNGNGIEGTMLTPADADSILSVGAISLIRTLPYFSSTGPTNDGRIKPDVVAPGVSIYCALPGKRTYGYQQGTSLAAPLAAGCAALVLSARPELTALEVRDALRTTADTANNSSHHQFPNNYLGWGITDAVAAALSFGPIFSNQPVIHNSIVSTDIVSKFGIKPDSVMLYYKTENNASYTPLPMELDSAMMFATSGRYSAALPSLPSGSVVQFFIEARDSAGNSYQSPAPIFNKQWQLCCGSSGVWSGSGIPEQNMLLQNYPNPFNSSTTIHVQTTQCERAQVVVHAVNGQAIKTLFDGVTTPEALQLVWDGNNEQGTSVASGIYFVRVTTPSFTSSTTMLLLR